eukprot:scaffold36092_cov79-Isochrysis_galbana.AAC.1
MPRQLPRPAIHPRPAPSGRPREHRCPPPVCPAGRPEASTTTPVSQNCTSNGTRPESPPRPTHFRPQARFDFESRPPPPLLAPHCAQGRSAPPKPPRAHSHPGNPHPLRATQIDSTAQPLRRLVAAPWDLLALLEWRTCRRRESRTRLAPQTRLRRAWKPLAAEAPSLPGAERQPL